MRLLPFAVAFLILFTAGARAQNIIPTLPAAPSEPAAEEAPGDELGVTEEQIQDLLATLKDETARQQLIQTLETLLSVQEPAEEDITAGLDTVGAQLLGGVSEALGQVGLVVERVGAAFVELHQFALRLKDQALDGETRGQAVQVVLQLVITLGAAIGALVLANLLLHRPQRKLAEKQPTTVARRVPHLLGRFFLDLLRLGITAVAGYSALLIVQDTASVRVITLAILNAILVSGAVYAVARFVLAPSASGIRLFPISDFLAAYLYIWVKRLTVPAVFGYFLLQMAVVLGIAPSTYRALVWLLGLLIAALVIVLILQNRSAVAAWISGAAKSRRIAEEEEERRKAEAAARAVEEDTGDGEFIPSYVHMPALRFLMLRRWLAPVWHLLAVLYVLVFYVIWVIQGESGWAYLASATLWTAVIFAAALLVLASLQRLLQRAFSISPELKEQFPDLEARANRYMPILSFVIKAVVLVVAALGILQAWEIGGFVWLATEAGRNILGAVVSILVAIGFAVAVWEVSSHVIERKLADGTDKDGEPVFVSGRTKTILGLVRNTVRIVLAVMLIIIILSEIGVDITPLLAGAGVIGLAIGFGAQTLVKDIITGLFILFEDTVSVGDVATLGNHTGVVEAMSIRTARLRDLSGTVHVVPYSEVTTVMNLTKDFSFALLEVGIAYREDVDEVMQVLHQIGDELRRDRDYRRDILEPLEMLGVDSFGDSAVIIKCRIKTKPIRQWYVMRGFNRLMKKRFDELGIEIPFPHQTIYFGVDKQGKAPAARVDIERLERVAGGELPSENAPDRGQGAEPAERG